jgi:recombination protein RecR
VSAAKQTQPASAGAFGGAAARPTAYPKAVDRLIGEFARLPGIGRRTAERLAFHILKSEEPAALALAQAITDVKQTVRHCTNCFNLSDGPLCGVCADPSRDRSLVLVVEQPKDLIALEQTAMYKGLYHVLMGHISPLEGVTAEDLTLGRLMERLRDASTNPGGAPVREVILGLNPTLEGDGTALYLGEQIGSVGRHVGQSTIRVSRLARGLPSGSQLEYANKAVLADAIHGRQKVE